MLGHGLSIGAVVRLSETGLRISGTPTLILADRDGIVVKVWQGKLDGDAEDAVMKSAAQLAGS